MNNLKNKKILILGFGREGRSSLRFLEKYYPDDEVAVADKQKIKGLSKKYKNLSGEKYLKAINDYDVIIKTPGINNNDLKPYLKNQIITSQTEIFLAKHREKTIAITGTKGKGITADLLYKIIRNAGKKVELAGNMGKPVLDFYDKKNCWFVFEISSHQLENLKISPHIAVFLNIYPDHLDFFKTFKRYFKAKQNITFYQNKSDYLVYNKEVKGLKTKAKKISFSRKKTIQVPFESSAFLENINGAITVAKLLKIKDSVIQKTVINYKPFKNRLENIGTYKGIKFINDSAATIPQATIAGLNNFKNIDTLILGGSEKGSNYKSLAKEIIKKDIQTLILFPITGKKIWQEIEKQKPKKLPEVIQAKDMKQAVMSCYKYTKKGKTCLLSPACASFSIFKDYQDRGQQFKKYIKQLAKTKNE